MHSFLWYLGLASAIGFIYAILSLFVIGFITNMIDYRIESWSRKWNFVKYALDKLKEQEAAKKFDELSKQVTKQ